MLIKETLLKNLLRLEVARKGQSATFAFAGFALFSFFYGYGCQKYLFFIKISAVLLFIVSILRFLLFKKIIDKNFVTSKEWAYTVTLVTLNGIGLAGILSVASFELQLSGIHFIVVTTLLAGLIGASTVTLSYFPVLFVPFQTILILPQVGVILYFYFSSEKINYIPLIILYVMYYAYQIKQFRAFRNDLVQMFTYQIELETKNQELSESKNVIIDQTIKLVHTSRLAVLGELSTGIAHEINNPLTIISGSSQMLNRASQNGTLSNDFVIRYFQKIDKSVDRISKIVKGLKHFANQSDSRPKEKVEIQEIVDETTQFCQELLSATGITLKLAEVPPVKIHCHSIQVSQVLLNLLKNASDALDAESRECEKWISINFKQDPEHFYFIVSNGGEKLPINIADKIFTPFFTTKDKDKGTGLGLSISQTIMKDHGGELYFDSVNEKTTFVIKHPIE